MPEAVREAVHPRAVAALGALLLLSAVPFVAGGYTVYLGTQVALFALAATGLNLLVGHLGLVSLGHAAFFGLGGYAVALTATRLGLGGGLTLVAAVLLAAAFAACIGPLVLRSHGIFFLMTTLAFAEMLHGVATQWIEVTRGTDGITGIPGLQSLGLGDPRALYGFALVLLFGALWLMRRLIRSPFGRVLQAIHHGETRARALGYPTFWYKYAAFVLSAALTGLAGGLHAHQTGFVSPHDLHWETSGVLLVMVLLGGRGALWGGFLGALAYIVLESAAGSWTDFWHLFIGLMLIGTVLVSRKGLWGLLERVVGNHG